MRCALTMNVAFRESNWRGIDIGLQDSLNFH